MLGKLAQPTMTDKIGTFFYLIALEKKYWPLDKGGTGQ